MTIFRFEDADQARQAIEQAAEYLVFTDGYTIDQLRDDMFEPTCDLLEDDLADSAS